MSKVRQVMKLYSQGIGKKRIGERLRISKNTVREYLRLVNSLQTPWDELLKLSDLELNERLHPPQTLVVNQHVQQLYDFYPQMEKQLRRRGMTVGIQFRQFKAAHPESCGETTFYKYYKLWKQRIYPSMHIEHKVADKAYLDYAGVKLPYVDPHSGEIKQAEVFIGILGWSQYPYVEAVESQTVEDFIRASENALRHFKGVPLALVPDNLKSAVFKADRYEPELNVNFSAFADHYGTSILPARVRKPKDKAHVENMVKICYQRIYTNLPQHQVLTLDELNTAIWKQLEELSNAKLTGKDCSRKQQWLLEQPLLQPLPATTYQMRKIKQVTVMKNGHIYLTEDQHYYSVPYPLIGKKLRLLYSRTSVELYDQYELVAQHKRSKSPHNYTTQNDHMAPQHRSVTEWSPSYFLGKAKHIDPAVEYFIAQVLAKKVHPEQAYKSCQGILLMARKVGNQRLINACKRASDIGYFNYKTIEDILKKQLDRYEEEPESTLMPAHDNIRGGDYYQ